MKKKITFLLQFKQILYPILFQAVKKIKFLEIFKCLIINVI